MANELESQIIRQIEYYFGDINLTHDKFLNERLKENDGWLNIEILLTFKRLARLSQDPEVILAAIEKSESRLIVISQDRKKICRNPDMPIPEASDARKTEIMECTAYAKGFNIDEPLSDIVSFMETFGVVASVKRRSTTDHKFKRSCFITFNDKRTCETFIAQDSIKYKGVELIRKRQSDYCAQKTEEYKKRMQSKMEKQAKLHFPKGAVIYFTGIPVSKCLSREEIKEKIGEVDSSLIVSYIEFNMGDTEGHVRFSTENAAAQFLQKLPDGELLVRGAKLQVRVLEGAEEEDYLRKTAEIVAKIRERAKAARMNQKRKRVSSSN